MRNWLGVTLDDKIPLGTWRHPDEADLARQAIKITEDHFAQSDCSKRTVSALANFFSDERAQWALKKRLATTIERRIQSILATSSPTNEFGFSQSEETKFLPHSLDHIIVDDLRAEMTAKSIHPSSITPVSALGPTLAVFVQGIRLFFTALSPMKNWHKKKEARKYFKIGSENGALGNDWNVVQKIASDRGDWIEGSFGILSYSPKSEPLYASWLTPISVSTMSVEPGRWFQEVIMPSLKLLCFCCYNIRQCKKDALSRHVILEALGAAYESIPYFRTRHNIRFQYFIDVEEYSSRPIIRSMVLASDGCISLRWPHSIMDVPGVSLSYIAYDLYVASGPYETYTYSKTWWSKSKTKNVGMLGTDDRVWTDDNVDPSYQQLLGKQKKAGRRIFVYFGPSPIPGIEAVCETILSELVDVLSHNPDWFLVIKPKGTNSERMMVPLIKKVCETASLNISERMTHVQYHNSQTEPCPTRWLLEEMSMGIGIGSVQKEGLCQNKPVLSFHPAMQRSPYIERLINDGLHFSSRSEFRTGLKRWIDKGNEQGKNFDWYKELFDPYGDGNAFDRIVDILYDEPEVNVPSV